MRVRILVERVSTPDGSWVEGDEVQSSMLGDDATLRWLIDAGKVEPVEEVEETEATYPRHAGGGWYELSDGSRVQGREAAHDAEEAL